MCYESGVEGLWGEWVREVIPIRKWGIKKHKGLGFLYMNSIVFNSYVGLRLTISLIVKDYLHLMSNHKVTRK